MAQVFPSEFYQIFKEHRFYRAPPVGASQLNEVLENISGGKLVHIEIIQSIK